MMMLQKQEDAIRRSGWQWKPADAARRGFRRIRAGEEVVEARKRHTD